MLLHFLENVHIFLRWGSVCVNMMQGDVLNLVLKIDGAVGGRFCAVVRLR